MAKQERWVLRVPARRKGERFIEQMREYLNKDSYTITKRYTGPRPYRNAPSTRREDAISIRLYVEGKTSEETQLREDNTHLAAIARHSVNKMEEIERLVHDWKN